MLAKSKPMVYGRKNRQKDNLNDAFAGLSLEAASADETRRSETPLLFVPSCVAAEAKQLKISDGNQSRAPLRIISSNPGPQYNPTSYETPALSPKKTKPLETHLPLFSRSKNPPLKENNEIEKLTSLDHVKDDVQDFEHACHLWADNYTITKIAHGSYAAIFRLQLRSDKSKYIIAKLMPLKPKKGKGSRALDQTSIEDAATEVKALDTMSEVPGFVGFSEAWVLRGTLPALIMQQYEIWARSNPDDGFVDYATEQLWCFIEMSDAGTDLERVLRKHASLDETLSEFSGYKPLKSTHCWDIFWGIAEALGRGEEFSEFEHRDLHPGNVCIMKNDAAMCSTREPSLRKKYTNMEVTLIDYTLSRATLADGRVLANPMRDKSVFEQRIENPSTQQQRIDSQQYETYRKMRRLVIEVSGTKDESQAWQSFVPQTNMLWLHHILDFLMCNMETHYGVGSEKAVPMASKKKSSRTARQLLHVPDAVDNSTATEEKMAGQLLKSLRINLNPDQCNACKWSSAKELLESELYWTDEVGLGHSAAYEDEELCIIGGTRKI